jgi:hypothetical protein
MGLIWNHTIWNLDIDPSDKLTLLWLADRTLDESKEAEFYLNFAEEYIGLSRRQIVRILKKYNGTLIEYSAGTGRGAKNRVKWLVPQRKTIKTAQTPVVIEEKVDIKPDIKPDIKVDIKDDISPTPPIRNNIYNYQTTPLPDRAGDYLDAVREVYEVNILNNEKRWVEQSALAEGNGIEPAQFTAALKTLLSDKSRKYPVTPEQVLSLAIENRLKAKSEPPPLKNINDISIDELLNPPGLPYIPVIPYEERKELRKCSN